MTISKIELLNKKFNRCMRGYCPDEVDLYLHDVAEALGQAADDNRRLAERLAQCDRSLAARESEPDPGMPPADLRGALAAGRRIVDEVAGKARQDAQRILEEARAEGARLLAEANLLKAKVYEDIADLRAQKEAMAQELRRLLEGHFRLLESSESSMDGKQPGGDFTFADGHE